MANKLYVIPGSHPCAAAEAALALKRVSYARVDRLPVIHRALGRVSYGARTVPALKLDGEVVVGSRAIMARLDELVAEPALHPADDERRARVERAEEWGDEVLQPLARRLAWAVLVHGGSEPTRARGLVGNGVEAATAAPATPART